MNYRKYSTKTLPAYKQCQREERKQCQLSSAREP